MKVSECRSCGAAIIWTATPTGSRMPVDAVPVPDGNRFLAKGPNDVPLSLPVKLLKQEDVAPLALDCVGRYVSHHATCPDADSWH